MDGHGAQRLQRGIEMRAGGVGGAGERAHQGAGRGAEREPGEDAQQRRLHMVAEFARPRELQQDVGADARGRRHQPALRPAEAHGRLPAERERQRQHQAQQPARATPRARRSGGRRRDGFVRQRGR